MTRGIHLKHLTATNLRLLGLSDELLGTGKSQIEVKGEHSQDPDVDVSMQGAWERDPVLRGIALDVRITLEETLILLDQALAVGQGCRPE
jgi:hypothetical protein